MINTDGVNQCGPDHPELCMYTTPEAMAIMFDWFEADRRRRQHRPVVLRSRRSRGVNQIVEGLKSPYSDEYTIGFSKRLGTKGLFRARLRPPRVPRLLCPQRDLSTGQVHWEGEVAPGVNVERNFDLG